MLSPASLASHFAISAMPPFSLLTDISPSPRSHHHERSIAAAFAGDDRALLADAAYFAAFQLIVTLATLQLFRHASFQHSAICFHY